MLNSILLSVNDMEFSLTRSLSLSLSLSLHNVVNHIIMITILRFNYNNYFALVVISVISYYFFLSSRFPREKLLPR